jgi:hypothetical protein
MSTAGMHTVFGGFMARRKPNFTSQDILRFILNNMEGNTAQGEVI